MLDGQRRLDRARCALVLDRKGRLNCSQPRSEAVARQLGIPFETSEEKKVRT